MWHDHASASCSRGLLLHGLDPVRLQSLEIMENQKPLAKYRVIFRVRM